MIASLAVQQAIREAEALLLDLALIRRRLAMVPGLADIKAQLEAAIRRLERDIGQLRELAR